MSAVRNYFHELSTQVVQGWNRFWFSPGDAYCMGAMRALIGAMALWFIVSYSTDLVTWFGPHGLLTVPTVTRLTGIADSDEPVFTQSILFYIDQPAVLWSVHVVAVLAAAMCMVGLFSRVASIVTLLMVLSYVHRAPMLTGQFEPVLTALLLYLCLGPSGRALSVDRWLKSRREKTAEPAPSLAANISLRLMQVHVVMFYLIFAFSKLAGEPWWNGEAVWWLMAQSESRLVDFSFLGQWNAAPVFNLWTYAFIAYEFSFAVFIGNRLARPLLLAIGIPLWLSLIPITGLTSFALIMLVANAAFVPATWWHKLADACCSRKTSVA